VIPTHDRKAILSRTIAALHQQRYPLDAIELIVVADGCSDGTGDITIDPPLAGHVIAQPSRGPAAARNRGAAVGSGDLLLFIDDDIEAWPDLVEAHVRAHRAAAIPSIVVGYLPPRLQAQRGPFAVALRGWWNAMFERMREPGHRFTYADVLTGNCSIPRSLFDAVGGFDESLRCHEDYEIGYRVLRAGGAIAFAPDAVGWHHEGTTLAGALGRKRDEGVADVAIARKHPEASPALPLANRRIVSRRQRLIRSLALTMPRIGDLAALAGRFTLAMLAKVRARQRWRQLLDALLWYWYWRGVGDALGAADTSAFRDQFGATASSTTNLPDLDLRPGLAAAARAIDQLAPQGIVLRYGSIHVATIPVQPWAEPLAGRHLRHFLNTVAADRLSEAIATTNALDAAAPPSIEAIRSVLAGAAVDDDRR
jgi:hypothetical protein